MLGFKSFQSAKNILAGIELMHMIRKGQMMMEGADKMSFAEQFYALAQSIHLVTEPGTSAHLKYSFLQLMRQNLNLAIPPVEVLNV